MQSNSFTVHLHCSIKATETQLKFSNLGAGQVCPGEHCDHNIHHHKMNSLSSIVSRHNKLQEWPQQVFSIWSENLGKNIRKKEGKEY